MEELLRQWRESRNPEALGELLKSQRDRAYSTALRMTGSGADAEDVVQEAFVKLLSREKGFEDWDSFQTTIYRSVLQCALDAIRGRKRRQMGMDKIQNVLVGARKAEGLMLETASEKSELTALLRSAVLDLPEEERTPVVLCYYQGFSISCAAKVMETPRETVRYRLRLALKSLRKRLAKNNKSAGAALMVSLLWHDGHIVAPASLCQKLDAVLPGKACWEIAASAPASMPAPGLVGGVSTAAFGICSATILAAVAMAGFYGDFWRTNAKQTEEIASADGPRTPKEVHGAVELFSEEPNTETAKKEEDDMKFKALAAAAVLTAAGTVYAGDGKTDGDADQIIAQIAARKQAKAKAESEAARTNSPAIRYDANQERRTISVGETERLGGQGGQK
jgi:RNA polymerase sigma-70 factor (ECF subfamily)